jgi:hypothetical protein
MKPALLPLVAALFAVAVPTSHLFALTSGDWSYSLNSADKATITGYSGPGGAVTIPSELDGKIVETIGGNWPPIFGYGNTSVTSVNIPDSVTSISGNAFSGCTALNTAIIPGSVTSIGGYAFQDCTSLTWVLLPVSLVSIEEGAFYGCTSLTSASIPYSVTNISNYLFYGCTSLASVTIGVSATRIGERAFYGCTSLTIVTIPDNVTFIGRSAFQQCSELEALWIPRSLTTIDDWAFAECTSLYRVVIPYDSQMTSIGESAFYYCTYLSEIRIPRGVTRIAPYTFSSCTRLYQVQILGEVTYIGESAFSHSALQRITGVEFSDNGLLSVRTFGSSAFYATSLEDVKIAATASFGKWTFPSSTRIRFDYTSLAEDDAFVAAVANKIIAALPSNYGIATKDDLNGAIANAASQAIAEVQAAPNSYDLFSADQYATSYNNGVTAGTSLVTANPASYNLYTPDSIMDLHMGGLMVQKQGGNAVVTFQPQTTADLTQPFTNNGTPITNTIPMPGNKGFIRVQAR